MLSIAIILLLPVVALGTSPSGLPVTIVSLTSPVSHGNAANISIKTAPGAACTIAVTYKSGPSRAKGLGPKIADNQGLIFWTWIVGTRTTPGQWPISVNCSAGGKQGTLETSFLVI
jgi:hypothetical protein